MIKIILFILSTFAFVFVTLKEDLSKGIEMEDRIKYPIIAFMVLNAFIQFFYRSLSDGNALMFYISLVLPCLLIYLEIYYNNQNDE